MDSTAERVAALLFAFETSDSGECSVSELARIVERERSQVSRMLKSLARGGLIEQDPIKRTYRLGWRLRVLAASGGNDLLVASARPVLQRLVATTGEVALLSVQEGDQCFTVMREESNNSLQAGGWVGRRSPLHCTASGRALLFDSDDEHVQSLTASRLGVGTRGPAAPRDMATLLQRLRKERQRGFCVASEEVEVGLTSVSAPVRDRRNHIVGVINVSGPTQRLHDRIEAIGDIVSRAAQTVSHNMRVPPVKKMEY